MVERVVLRAKAIFELTYHPEDFDSEVEWKRFVNQIKTDKELAKRCFELDYLRVRSPIDYIDWNEVFESLEVIHEGGQLSE